MRVRTTARRHLMAMIVVTAMAGASAALAEQFTVSQSAADLTLDEVLFRANEAVVRSQRDLAVALAEERYEQRALDGGDQVRRERILRSDYALVWLPEHDVWGGFRDVFEVDGSPVGSRSRLGALAFDDPADLELARQISVESARHDIGDAMRAVNVPTLPLIFLFPINQYRFHFEKIGEEDLQGIETWVVRYSEHQRPTLVRAGGTELFARGRFWIEPLTGTVVRSELLLGDDNTIIRAHLLVTFRSQEGIWVPARMEETFDYPRQRRTDRVTGVLTYSNYRWPDADVPASGAR